MAEVHEPLEFNVTDMTHRIEEIFRKFDKDGSGCLDGLELRNVFRHLSPKFSTQQIAYYCKWLNEAGDGDGQVSSVEFMRWLQEGSAGAKEVTQILIQETGGSINNRVRELFQRFDKDGGGYLDASELSRLFRTLSSAFTYKDITDLCEELDQGGDGRYSRQEFMLWLKKSGEAAKTVMRALLSQTGEEREAKIKEAFKKYDPTGDGMLLSIAELQSALNALGSFSPEEVRNVCADLDKSRDGEISYQEFSAWIRDGSGDREVIKAKAILAPSDSDGLEAVFYNFCGAGKADMDGKSFLKVCEDCSLLSKKFTSTAVDLIFSDTKVKRKGQRVIDFNEFEVALELVADRRGLSKEEVRQKVVLQGKPKISARPTLHSSSSGLGKMTTKLSAAQKHGKADQAAEKSRRPRKEVELTSLWKIFGCNTEAGRALKSIYAPRRHKIKPWNERVGTPVRLRPEYGSRKPRAHVITHDNFMDICVQVVRDPDGTLEVGVDSP
eukprot:CAMPEP_0197624796 /NCGR_PEP_ID=MMETSP1338-20131121/4326_1 /TAXON_ID=43686 ORGANISM="Pelagodinium beii, Strain RCC1491" /NCGR_SAMPLE_ID=MMETSP1338 /ASSEMBLY_ACC=CAM_ASM_000754 /LENGTH=495 /DNA_ID=CAMNT_0043195025 /DNA_START=67 /DNA_END=1554 /DNA_ORIENTATION=+